MALEVTPEAAAVLRRSLELAKIDPSSGGGVRLRGAKTLGGAFDVQVELAHGPNEGELVLEEPGVTVYVDASVTALYPHAIVTVEPQHETIVVRPQEP